MLRCNLWAPKQSDLNQIVDQQPLRGTTKAALGPQFDLGVSSVENYVFPAAPFFNLGVFIEFRTAPHLWLSILRKSRNELKQLSVVINS